MENLTDEEYFYYILHLIHEDHGRLVLSRTIWFNRLDLRLARQIVYDSIGNIVTDARYSQWHVFENVAVPQAHRDPPPARRVRGHHRRGQDGHQ